MIHIARPDIGNEEVKAVSEVLLSGMLAQGKQVEEFEHRFASMVGAKYAIAVANGTCALHVANLAHGIGAGNEVVTTAFSFMATANSVLYCGGVPVFVDIEKDSFNLDLNAVEAAITPQTKAIQPVHLYGNPVDMDRLQAIADKHNVAIIQDAAQAHGATVRGRPIGKYGTACYSFYPTKNITTGEGGVITTNDEQIAQKCKLLREHGMSRRYFHDILGFNFRMTNIAAAIGLVQLTKLEHNNNRRRENAHLLTSELAGVKGLVTPTEQLGMGHVYHQYTVRVLPEFGMTRDEFADGLRQKGVGSMVYYPRPIHQQAALQHEKYVAHPMPVTDEVCEQVLSLPVHPLVSKEDVKNVAVAVRALAH